MISSFVGAIAYLVSAIILIPAFKLKGAAFSFIFILLPYPVYVYILNKAINFSQIEYLKILGKSLIIIVITLVLNFVSSFIFMYDTIVYVVVNVVIFGLVNSLVYLLRILDFEEVKNIINRGLNK
jgi:O-antigen/teichoic acid export membrane protein